jgi:hypothetical protein
MGTQVSSQQSHGERAVFECEVCGTRRVATAVEYDRFGYPVCPVCTYRHGP